MQRTSFLPLSDGFEGAPLPTLPPENHHFTALPSAKPGRSRRSKGTAVRPPVHGCTHALPPDAAPPVASQTKPWVGRAVADDATRANEGQ